MTQATVALLSPPFSSLTYLLPDYLPPEAWHRGQRVAVPLGKGLRVGVILDIARSSSVGGEGGTLVTGEAVTSSVTKATSESFSGETAEEAPKKVRGRVDPAEAGRAFSLKALCWPLEKKPLLTAGYLELAIQLALRQNAAPGQILGNLLPAGLRTTQTRIRFFGPGKPRELKVRALLDLSAEEHAVLAELWMQDRAEVCLAGRLPLDTEACVLLADPPWPVRPAAKAQTALLEYLFERGAVIRRKLQGDLGPQAATTLSTLVKRGLVAVRPADASPCSADPLPGELPTVEAGTETEAETAPMNSAAGVPHTPLVLTPHQQAVYGPLSEALRGGKAETRLLFGITGSGKTAVYLELARDALKAGRSVMLLAPEVALALKLRRDVAGGLPGVECRLFHGYQSAGDKEAAFRALAGTSGPMVVVGTRSALFLPLENIGLIVLDEEHDSSFKQDEGFVYQAKEVAWYRAGQQNALLLLGSATPDIKSYHAACEGRIPLHILTERVGGGTLPEVRLVQLPKGRADAGLLVPETIEALTAVVSRGEQAIILLNRRGYAPLMYCLSCTTVAKCPHCDIGLAYHKGRERLLCHYCGYSTPFPSPCTACKGVHFLPMGEGTEKLEEHLTFLLPPGTGILRLDRDSTRRPGRMDEILQAFARKEASVLVGTQMLSKGHHFPDVTLAVVADADLGLNLPDYRAAERTFQLLLQSAGRSGRGERGGCVLIQTRDPSHYCWQFVREADYEGFFVREAALRQKRLYPPFIRLALVRISHAVGEQNGADEVTALGAVLRAKGRELGVTVLGPAPAPLPFLKGRKRYHCLVKGKDWQPLRALYSAALEATGKGCLRVRLDLDPVNML